MGKKRGESESQFPYSLPTTKFFEFRWGQRTNLYVSFSPVIPPPDFVSKTFLGDITFLLRSIREPDNSSKSTMVSTSSKAVKVAPKMVGAGLENAATGLGMSERKRAASMSPPKPRISSNLDGRRGRLGRTVRNESDFAAGATRGSNQPPTARKKTRSGAKEASGATAAPDGGSGHGDKIPKSHVGHSSRVRANSPGRTPVIRLSTSCRRADSDESGGDGSSKCKETGGAQDIIFHNTDDDEEEDEDDDEDDRLEDPDEEEDAKLTLLRWEMNPFGTSHVLGGDRGIGVRMHDCPGPSGQEDTRGGRSRGHGGHLPWGCGIRPRRRDSGVRAERCKGPGLPCRHEWRRGLHPAASRAANGPRDLARGPNRQQDCGGKWLFCSAGSLFCYLSCQLLVTFCQFVLGRTFW